VKTEERAQPSETSAFPTEILPGFLYLGSYDNASRSELLKAQGVTHILNVRPITDAQPIRVKSPSTPPCAMIC
jgi:dual specificity MAP kinase phosphatase